MCRCTKLLLVFTLCVSTFSSAESKFPGVGRAATAAEIAAWDIDVRPDLKGLPKGSGSVSKGQEIWEAKCASCHGTFGESNEVFTPIIGGTTATDIKSGRVKALLEPVARTTFMKVSSISTLWDYINRAMPWNAPKSLSTDEVYAVLAYMLNLADIVSADFVLNEKSMHDVQQRLPNRNGKMKYDGLWNLRGKGDVQNIACMKDCKIDIGIASALPEFAQNTHGNLAEQQRGVRSVRGAEIAKPENAMALVIATKSNCMACHDIDKKRVGPSYREVAARYSGDAGAEFKLSEKVKKGGGGVWGAIPMPANAINDDDLRAVVKWVLTGAPD